MLSIDEEPPYTIRLKGELKEQAFKLVNIVIATELSTEPGAQRHFDITYTFLADKSAVDSALQQVQKIQHDRPTEVRASAQSHVLLCFRPPWEIPAS